MSRLSLPPRIRDHLELRPCPVPHLDGPCWCWMRRLNRNGYGRVWHAGREPVVHRVTYELLIGPVPAGLILDHRCKVRRCCNPGHLEPVTVAENTRRGEAVLFERVTPPVDGSGSGVEAYLGCVSRIHAVRSQSPPSGQIDDTQSRQNRAA